MQIGHLSMFIKLELEYALLIMQDRQQDNEGPDQLDAHGPEWSDIGLAAPIIKEHVKQREP